jgi:hypothetical protein
MESTPEPTWSRSGHHSERGDTSLDDLLKIYSHHGESHLGHITGLRKAKG